MGEACDHIELCLPVRGRGVKGDAFRKRDNLIIAAMNEKERRLQFGKLLRARIEALHVRANLRRKRRDQLRYPVRVVVRKERVDGPTVSPELGRQGLNIRLRVLEFELCHLPEKRLVKSISHPAHVALEEHPLSVGIGLNTEPWPVRRLAKVAAKNVTVASMS